VEGSANRGCISHPSTALSAPLYDAVTKTACDITGLRIGTRVFTARRPRVHRSAEISPASKVFLALLGIATWTVAAHLVFSIGEHARAATLFAWAPIAATTLWLVRHARLRIAWITAIALTTLAILLLVPARSANASLVYQLQYLAMQAVLATAFGRTLIAGHEPLVTRFARLVHGELPPPVERYTRGVTAVWTAFFTVMAAVAIALYVFASREAWSAFVNLLTIPCVTILFIVEYAVRRIRFPDFEHVSILEGARAFRRAFISREPPR
jgi:uncharacterized membrane protein